MTIKLSGMTGRLLRRYGRFLRKVIKTIQHGGHNFFFNLFLTYNFKYYKNIFSIFLQYLKFGLGLLLCVSF